MLSKLNIRKIHRYLGVFIGIQFMMWTISGLYFSWTDIDEIHGDHFLNDSEIIDSFNNLKPFDQPNMDINSLELLSVAGKPYYWVNQNTLYDAITGNSKDEISEEEARKVISKLLKEDLEIIKVEKIFEVGSHHEYRGRPLPAYAIHLDHPENLVAYIDAKSGKFQRVRHRNWRWFDFLWMTHTMDYQGRDDFNNILLRIFSVFGLFAVLSGFLLWFITSKTIRRFF
ncbi:MAG: hypothetical protein CMC79_02725 [Flavobacteriaceae bacterium]|nr:hypothetical protein [Flavobacteriaceae bacterium]|tara:strand:+ start:8315 stop:8995 length:681 start_codon:yes stop_codon:yes gene_type:complete